MGAICLLSGGLDSAANLHLAVEAGVSVKSTLFFDYGQRSKRSELRAAESLSHVFGVQLSQIHLPWMESFPGALTERRAQVPVFSTEDLKDNARSQRSASQVWVPNRNGVFIEIAAGLAESSEVETILVGFNQEEAATFPDNSTQYLEAVNRALSFSTQGRVNVASFTQDMTKNEIVRRLGPTFPYHLLWSCYLDGERMCGHCESCARLTRALIAEEIPIATLFAN